MGLLVLSILFIPLAGAVQQYGSDANSPVPLAKDDPQIIAALKSNVVYVGESQQARMNGVIRYIDSISNGTGTDELRWIQEDYLTAASTIPLLYTSDKINSARKEMQDQSVLFSDTSADEMVLFGVNTSTMRSFINSSMKDFDASFNDPNRTPWLTTGRARLIVFNDSANGRNSTLANLSSKGIDVSEAQNLSDSINAEYGDLLNALSHKGGVSVSAVNSRIKILNQGFRDSIRRSYATLKIQSQTAEILAIKE